ncbi:MAG: DUF3788 family protein [Bryobacterales bacterium]|nr:DUF3788 family protein [Bryobacterales bacterium]
MAKAEFPGDEVVLAGVGRALWEKLVAALAAECGAGEYEWKKYAKKAPWSLRVKREGRVIVYLLPGEGEFTASFALGGRALELAREAGLGALLEGAKKYAEGTAVRVLVRNEEDMSAVVGLARVKIAG